MNLPSWFEREHEGHVELLSQDGERVLCRRLRDSSAGERHSELAVLPASEHPTASNLERLAHEYGLRELLEAEWAVRPLQLVQERGRAVLILEDSGGEPLERLLDRPMEIERFLRVAIGLAVALGHLHKRGLVHKDVKPTSVFVNPAGEVRLTGFGIASRSRRERQTPEPPEIIAGTLAYMAPEQTGRMNRSIDSRSDLYALGVTLYRMITGTLPFSASDPMAWVHCHVARRPAPPTDRVNVPGTVSAIIMKLLAKTAEDRYQTAAGVESDLRRCLDEWEAERRIEGFPLGRHDTPDRLLIPEKLYGREAEVETLLAAFDRIVQGGPPELVLISGTSGIGKSSVVNELQKVSVPPRDLVASGKFEESKRDIPYSTLGQAFRDLTRRLLVKSDDDLAPWRDGLRDALGQNGRLMTDLIPELTLVIGEQPPVPELPAPDAQRRFLQVFRRFIGVFTRPEHPLALFLDDLQWIDPGTLEVVEDLLTRSDDQHLLVIGAYRDSDVDHAHPLMRKLDAIRQAGTNVTEISLTCLACADVQQIVADTLRCEPAYADPLARLVYHKTDGNPFFLTQFLNALADEELLTFDHAHAEWSWDVDRIRAKGYTDNVVDLMVEKLRRLPRGTQAALQRLSCLGRSADVDMLSQVSGKAEDVVHSDLWEAVRQEVVERSGSSYRFVHDRIQEATYSLIPEESRADAHLQIGRLLATHMSWQREESIFDIANQLNRGVALITEQDEREQLAEFNLMAGQRAKSRAAYASALIYLAAGAGLLPGDCWERRHDLAFALELTRAECEYITGQHGLAEGRLSALAARTANLRERAALATLQVDLYVTLGQPDRASAACLEYLKHLGVEWSAHPTDDEVSREYERIWSQLGTRAIGDLIDLPLMSDPGSLATLDLLTKAIPPAWFTDTNLGCLVTCRAANLSLEGGNSDSSCTAYEHLGILAGPRFGNYKAGAEFGRLGYELVEKRGLKRFQSRTYMLFGNVIMPWTTHIRAGRDLVRRAFDVANEVGDLTFAAFSCKNLITNLLAAGDPLVEVQREAEKGFEFAKTIRFGFAIDTIATQLGLIRTLRGLTRTFGCFDDDGFDEALFEHHLASSPGLMPQFWYWTRRTQARLLACDYGDAVDAALTAHRLVWTSPSWFETAECHFYGALAHAASWDSASPSQRQHHFSALLVHHDQLQTWALNCPANFENRAALVEAEIARIEGRELDAERLYEKAIRSSRANGFVHNQALACELAARFYAIRGFEDIAVFYRGRARDCYRRWGADGKARQLEETYPEIRDDERAHPPTSTIGTAVEHLDLATVIEVSQAVAGGIVLEKTLDTLMITALEHAGAERGLLILPRAGEQRIVAEATTVEDTVAVQIGDRAVDEAVLPQSVLQYALRTHETVILDDAAAQNPFSSDPYIRERQARSVLCLPLLNQARLTGVLYLENNLAPHVFVPRRTAVLKLLASEAAISLENARLYGDLAEREARIRRLVDANIIGIFIWDLHGRILDANDAFLRMVGYDRNDVASGRVRWTDLTPPEWLERDEQEWAPVLKATGSLPPFEKEYFRKDGSRVPVLIGIASFEDVGNQGVAFVLDLTERKRSEAEARENERRYREVQMELAQVSRTTSLNALTASIAHEINQPLSGIITNAGTCLRMLDADPPNINGARETARRALRDGNRASDVIVRLRALFSKKEFRLEPLDLNEATREVIELSASELRKNRIMFRSELADDLPIVTGDRIQLQQVIVNLIRNGSDAMVNVDDRPRHLLIKTERENGGRVRLTLRDAGVGLPEQGAESLFDAFYSTKSDGMGIGLFVSRSIVERHNGRLWAERNDGPGATFSFSIPCDSPEVSGAMSTQTGS
jgi:PAS domain S-box-containing protein